MSELSTCEVCGSKAYRYMSRLCPVGWLFGIVKDEDLGDDVVVMVCSQECAGKFFRPGGERNEISKTWPDCDEQIREEDRVISALSPSQRRTLVVLLKAGHFDGVEQFRSMCDASPPECACGCGGTAGCLTDNDKDRGR